MSDLSLIVKAYDVRGTVPDQLNETVAEALGTAFAENESAATASWWPTTCASRASAWSPRSPGGHAAGTTSSTPGSARPTCCTSRPVSLGLPGAMFTASHNPAQYNGIKMCRAGARPIGQDSGLAEIRERAQAILDGAAPSPTRRAG